jgi:hypothetical protein
MIEIIQAPDYAKNSRHSPTDTMPCVICGRPINTADCRLWVHVVEGGSHIILPDTIYGNPAADLLYYPIGSNCLRVHPEYKPYIVKN